MRYTIASSLLLVATAQAAPQAGLPGLPVLSVTVPAVPAASPVTLPAAPPAAPPALKLPPLMFPGLTLPSLNLPLIPALPVQGVPDVVAGNGFNSLAMSLTTAAIALNHSADLASIANGQLTGDFTVDPSPVITITLDIVQAAGAASASLWQLAYDLENKTCSIVTSINQQNFANQEANLIAALQAQARAIVRLQLTLAATVAAIKRQAVAFTDAEKAILTSAIQAFVASALTSTAPLTVLTAGLQTIGQNAIASAVSSLQLQTDAFALFASQVNFVGL